MSNFSIGLERLKAAASGEDDVPVIAQRHIVKDARRRLGGACLTRAMDSFLSHRPRAKVCLRTNDSELQNRRKLCLTNPKPLTLVSRRQTTNTTFWRGEWAAVVYTLTRSVATVDLKALVCRILLVAQSGLHIDHDERHCTAPGYDWTTEKSA